MERQEDNIKEGKTVAKTKQKTSSLKQLLKLWHYLLPYRKYLVLAFFFVVLSGSVTLLFPYVIRLVIDHGFEDGHRSLSNEYFIGLFVVISLLAVSSSGRVFAIGQLGENIVKDLRIEVFNHLVTLSPGFYDTTHSGELVSRLATDTNEIKNALTGAASIALRNIITIIGGLFMMFVMSVKLSSIALLTIPILIIILIYWGRSLRFRTKIARDCIARGNACASDYLSAIRTVQASGAERRVMQRFSFLVCEAYRATLKSLFSRAILTASAMLLVFGAVVVILWVGAYDVAHGLMSAGQLSQFMIYTILAGSAMGQLSEVFTQLQQAAGACERLVHLLEEKTRIAIPSEPDKLIEPVRGDIRFCDVSFAYPSKKRYQILSNLSLHVAPGETVAIVGPSGSGKTTILSLLLRFYDAEGKIFLDGQDISTLRAEDVRRQIGYVAQDVDIFKGNFYDNIAFGVSHYRQEEIVEAAKIAQAYDFIIKYRDGFETDLGERGVVLSGGQRQRIGLARAILRKTPILLLDEATSALDTQSEKLVQEAIEELMQGRTTLIIAHRLSTILKADRIFVIERGRLVESGTHRQLLEQKGLYAKLTKLQFSENIERAAKEAAKAPAADKISLDASCEQENH